MEPKIQKITHDRESQSSSQTVASVDDLLIDIFLRIPMKLLIRFKSVSKHWQSLISDSKFGILRNPNPNPATGLILQVPPKLQRRPDEMAAPYAYIVSFNTSPRIRTLKCKDSWPYHKTTIMSSCNGLILMCGSYKNLESSYDYYVCNPTTNTNFELPEIPDEADWMLRPMCLAFDPSNSPHYKVVCAVKLESEDPEFEDTETVWYKFMVYSSETGSWRKSFVEPFEGTNVNLQRGVYWRGAIHWVSITKTGKSIYFDPVDDRMSREIMPTPPILNNNQNNPFNYFGESCGHLHYIADCRMAETVLNVYELKRDYSEWFVKFRINHDPSFSVGGHKPFLCDVVRGKSDDDSFSVLQIGSDFVWYNFLKKTRETICEVGGTPLEKCFPRVYFQHAESLCSV